MFIVNRSRWGKPVSASAMEEHRIELFHEKTDPNSIFFGGKLLELVEKVALIVADSHAEVECETIGIDFVRFFKSVKFGDLLICKASVNRTWNEKIEVGIKVVANDFRMLEEKKILSAYFHCKVQESDAEIPFIIPESKEEKKRFIAAEKRRLFKKVKPDFSIPKTLQEIQK